MAINPIRESFPTFRDYAHWRLSSFSSAILYDSPLLRSLEVFSSFDGRCYRVLPNGDITQTEGLLPWAQKALIITQLILFPLTLLCCALKAILRWRNAYQILPSILASSQPMTFESKLALWALCEGGRANEASEVIKKAYYEKHVGLVLDGFKLKSLPREMGLLTHLTHIGLVNNRLDILPKEFWNLHRLTLLNLDGNYFKRIPSEIGQLTNLRILDLSENKLSDLPTEIWRLSQLRMLGLAGNYFKTISDEISRLTQLTNLYLANNWLKELPPSLGLLPRLDTLDLSRNYALRDIPLSLRQNTKLAYLNLGDTQVRPNSTILPAFERAEIDNRRRENRLNASYF